MASIASIVGFCIYVGTQIATYRSHRLSLLSSIFFSFVGGAASTCLIVLVSSDAFRLDTLLTQLVVFGALGYGYFHWINLCETARRIRILLEFANQENGVLTYAELLERYSAKNMVEFRLNRLLSKEQIILKNDRLFIGKKMLLNMALFMNMIQRFLVGDTTARKSQTIETT